MEDNFEEYRSLLDRKKKATIYQRLKSGFLNISKEKKIVAIILISAILGIALILGSNNGRHTTENVQSEGTDSLRSYNDKVEQSEILEEWQRGKTAVLNLFMSHRTEDPYLEMEENTRNFNIWKGNFETVSTVKPTTLCSLTAEHVKRKIQECVSIDILPEECKYLINKHLDCDANSRYKSLDGSCNNLKHTDWGMSGIAFRRWLKPVYADDVSAFRRSVTGVPLPNARVLTDRLYSHKTLPNNNITMLFVFFGLFLDHDLVQSMQTNDKWIDCCSPNPSNPACLQIDLPAFDPFFSPLNVTCMGFIRGSPTIGLCPGRREQGNVMSSYIDASDMYGPDDVYNAKLRTFKNGRLRTTKIGNTTLLPLSQKSGNNCYTEDTSYECFLSGDQRVNMVTSLMVQHTMWFREHNRLADELHELNPNWNDEKLFQEARKILIAEMQLVTYREFLPLIFGQNRMKEMGLKIDENNIYDGYDEGINAGIYTAFASSAFRFGHTLVRSEVELRDSDYQLQRKFPFYETYFNPNLLFQGYLDSIIRGFISQKVQQVELYTTEQVRNRLLERYFENYGFDLSAITILRGRDHGLPSYVKFRELCKLPVPNSWEDLYSIIRKRYISELRNVYMSVEDIDLVVGALGEYHEPDALLGATNLCLISKQFLSLRKGDRFWFENLHHPGSFTRDQLMAIYDSSFARIICDTSDNISAVQKFPLLMVSEQNPMVRCEDVPKMDMFQWKETLMDFSSEFM